MNSELNKVTSDKSARQKSLAGLRKVAPMGLLVLIVATSTLGNPALADNHQRTRAEAIEIAKQRSGDGRVLSVKKRVNEKGVSVYAVKIISNGRVKVFSVREFKS